MGGKGELVKYTRLFAKTPQEKALLKQQINAIIDEATHAITVEAMVEALPQDIVKEVLDKKERHKSGGS